MTHLLRKSFEKPVQYNTVNRLAIAQWSDCACNDAHSFSNSLPVITFEQVITEMVLVTS
jgi:hypothetical protein